MAIKTPLTELLDIEHPILLAPMDVVSGGRLAAAVSAAGGLGLIGGGYGDGDWIEGEFAAAGNQVVGASRIGCSISRSSVSGVLIAIGLPPAGSQDRR